MSGVSPFLSPSPPRLRRRRPDLPPSSRPRWTPWDRPASSSSSSSSSSPPPPPLDLSLPATTAASPAPGAAAAAGPSSSSSVGDLLADHPPVVVVFDVADDADAAVAVIVLAGIGGIAVVVPRGGTSTHGILPPFLHAQKFAHVPQHARLAEVMYGRVEEERRPPAAGRPPDFRHSLRMCGEGDFVGAVEDGFGPSSLAFHHRRRR